MRNCRICGLTNAADRDRFDGDSLRKTRMPSHARASGVLVRYSGNEQWMP